MPEPAEQPPTLATRVGDLEVSGGRVAEILAGLEAKLSQKELSQQNKWPAVLGTAVALTALALSILGGIIWLKFTPLENAVDRLNATILRDEDRRDRLDAENEAKAEKLAEARRESLYWKLKYEFAEQP